jgi:amidase
VEDNARVLSAIATTASGEGQGGTDYVAQLSRVSMRGARIGVLRPLARPDSMDPQVAKLFAAAIADLRAAGAVVVDDVLIEDFQKYVDDGYYCPRFRADVNAYLQSLGQDAPVRDIAAVFKQGRFAPASREQFAYFLNLNPAGEPIEVNCPEFAQQPGRQAFRSAVVDALNRAQLAALIYPTWTHPPALRSRAVVDYRGDNSQLVAPATGLPAITVPMGFTQQGLPAGLQMLGRPWAESELYGLAFGYERATHHRIAPSRYPPLTR